MPSCEMEGLLPAEQREEAEGWGKLVWKEKEEWLRGRWAGEMFVQGETRMKKSPILGVPESKKNCSG